MSASLLDRFRGCLLGSALGDPLGGRFEARRPEHLRERFPGVEALFDYPQDELWYTDDAQMMIGVAEALITDGHIVEETLVRAFATNYVPSRGYGRGARVVLEAMEDGRDYRRIAAEHFPGGSYGNGAAMRVAPVGLVFRDDFERCVEEAKLSSLPTHVHPLGIEGAQLIALAVSLASHAKSPFDRDAFFDRLLAICTTDEYRQQMELASKAQTAEDLAGLGNRIEALFSAPTAIASFAISPESYIETVGRVILLGGDTDTLAAMAGAISGAYLGESRLPTRLVNLIESSPKGRAYIARLADQLCEVYQKMGAA